MSTTNLSNPYSAPVAALEARTAQPTYPARFFTWKGRIDRMRYLGYSSLAFLLFFSMTITGNMLWAAYAQVSTDPLIYEIYNAAGIVILPLLAHGIYARRRLYDLGQSGWFAVLACIPIVFIAMTVYLMSASGSAEPNEHGPAAASGRLVLLWLVPILLALLLLIFAAIGIAALIYQSYMWRSH